MNPTPGRSRRGAGLASPRRGRAVATGTWVAALLVVVGLLATGALAGCGYSTRRLVEQPGVASVAVAQFDNQTFRHDLEQRLTKTVAEEVRARTPWRMLSPSTADAVLTGTIREATTDVLAEDDDSQRTPIARRWRLTVDCTLTARRTGAVLRAYTVEARQEYGPGRYGETDDGSATDTVLRTLAIRIVQGLERPVGDDDAAPPDRRKLAPRTDAAPRELPFPLGK